MDDRMCRRITAFQIHCSRGILVLFDAVIVIVIITIMTTMFRTILLRIHLLFLAVMILDDGFGPIVCGVAPRRLKRFHQWRPAESVGFELLVITPYHYGMTGEQREEARFSL